VNRAGFAEKSTEKVNFEEGVCWMQNKLKIKDESCRTLANFTNTQVQTDKRLDTSFISAYQLTD